jgi:hypothetical protein
MAIPQASIKTQEDAGGTLGKIAPREILRVRVSLWVQPSIQRRDTLVYGRAGSLLLARTEDLHDLV